MAFPTGWTLLQKCIIDNTKVSGSSDLTNFPVLLTEANILSATFDNTDNGGGDVRFSSDLAGNTQLACEVVKWDTSTDKAEVWVKIPTVEYDADTVFYLWGDNTGQSQPSASDTYGSQAVWSGYAPVLHLNGTDGATSTTDSSSGGKTFTFGGNAQIDTDYKPWGQSSALFDGNGDYIETADSADFAFGSGEFTIDVWYRRAGGDGTRRGISNQVDSTAASTNQGHLLAHWGTGSDGVPTNGIAGRIDSGSSSYWINSNSGITDSNWHKITLVRRSNTLYMHVDGVQQTATANLTGVTANDSAYKLALGKLGESTYWYLNGSLKEYRIIKGTGRTADWITTEYNNQNSPSTFITESAVSDIKKVIGVAQASLKKVTGIVNANVKKILGVQN